MPRPLLLRLIREVFRNLEGEVNHVEEKKSSLNATDSTTLGSATAVTNSTFKKKKRKLNKKKQKVRKLKFQVRVHQYITGDCNKSSCWLSSLSELSIRIPVSVLSQNTNNTITKKQQFVSRNHGLRQVALSKTAGYRWRCVKSILTKFGLTSFFRHTKHVR